MSRTTEAFLLRLRAISLVAQREGPHTNVFAFQQEACSLLDQLREEVGQDATISCHEKCLRMVAVDADLIPLLIGVEQVDDALRVLLRGYTLLLWVLDQRDATISDAPCEADLRVVEVQEVIRNPFPKWKSFPFWAASLCSSILNGFGLWCSLAPDLESGVSASIACLQRAETIYQEWNAELLKFRAGESIFSLISKLPIGDKGDLVMESIPEGEEQHNEFWSRYLMEITRLTTTFFLTQALINGGSLVEATGYCHQTLYLQFLLHKQTSLAEWSRNVLQLATKYSSYGAFSEALHCLQAAEDQMPKTSDEETTGAVSWTYIRFYKHLLHCSGQRLQATDPTEVNAVVDESAIRLVRGTWVDFPIPGVPAAAPMELLATAEQAKEAFKKGFAWGQEALRVHPFDILCRCHIDIQRDICALYDALSAFETDPCRVIALCQRQISTMDEFPKRLNFNSYPSLIRQLLYDVGCMKEHLVELRVAQYQRCAAGDSRGTETALAPRDINKLVLRALKAFSSFCETWRPSAQQGKAPANEFPSFLMSAEVAAEESTAVFRAMVRMSRLYTVFIYATPVEEYDGVKKARNGYEQAVAFAEHHHVAGKEPSCDNEIDTAKSLITLLKNKEYDLYSVYSSK